MSDKLTSHPNSPAQPAPSCTGMLKKFSCLVRLLFLWIFKHVIHDPAQVQEILAIPKDEAVIYLLDSENRHDFLFLNDLCLKTGMPLALASNGKSKLCHAPLAARLSFLFKGGKKRLSPNELALYTQNNLPVLIYLNQYGLKEREHNAQTCAFFDAINKHAQRTPHHKIHFITVGVIWERRAESYQTSLFNELYGTPTHPSSIRRFLAALPSLFQIFFQIGNPLCIIHSQQLNTEMSQKSGNDIRTLLNDDIETMHTQVNGPKVKPHQLLLSEIVNSSAFQNEIRTIAQATGQSPQELTLEARKILNKASSKFSLLICKLFTTALTPMWSIIYNGLCYDTEKLNQIRELSKTHRLVFIPSHKSHIDYLVLSIIMFQNGVLPPHIAAGENLNFFPVGGILRRGGAFFIRRSFRGEQLYTTCIRFYIDKILHEGFPLEFFIEGGRSRTGQVLQPKFGILRMIAQAVQHDPSLPVLIIPCATTYEKVIEDMGYKNEQEGGAKQKENFTKLIKTTKLLISKYGQIYISFADPIDLNQALHVNDPNHPQTEQSLTDDIDEMAVELMKRINRASTITMSALLSSAILNHSHTPIPTQEILKDAAFLLSLLISRNARISPVLQTALQASRANIYQSASHQDSQSPHSNAPIAPDALIEPLENPILETIKLFEQNGSIKKTGDKTHPQIAIKDSGRLQLAFYKNILLFDIIDDIYLAWALQFKNDNIETVKKYFFEIADILSIEFSISDPEEHFNQTLELFQNRHWIQIQNASLKILSQSSIDTLSHCIAHHIDSYKFVFQAFHTLQDITDESQWVASLMNASKEAVLKKQMLAEARSKVVFCNAIRKLQALKCFDVSYEQNGKKSAKYLHKIADLPNGILKFAMQPKSVAQL